MVHVLERRGDVTLALDGFESEDRAREYALQRHEASERAQRERGEDLSDVAQQLVLVDRAVHAHIISFARRHGVADAEALHIARRDIAATRWILRLVFRKFATWLA
jgi:hypothetical protein